MNELLLYTLIAGTLGLFLGYILSKLNFQNKFNNINTRLKTEKELLETKIKSISHELEEHKNIITDEINRRESLLISVTQKESAIAHLESKLKSQTEETEKLQEKFSKEFENLANKILEEKTTKFTEQNKQNLEQILSPLNEKIKSFEKKVEDTHKESIDYQAALRQQIIGLKELNQQMSKEAVNLTKALKGDSKTQGNWGELVLERVLEKSGLVKGREYEMEKSFTVDEASNKRLRPDVIVHLPDNKKMIIDSKVSLTHYEQYINTEDENERDQFLKMHIQSLNRHVEQLSAKKYEDLYEIESPDFVLLFVPIEPAFAIALNNDNQLYNKAFEKNIVIVTPTTLLATLRTIDSMWNNEKQQQNAIEIARQAGGLYDKFEGLINDLMKVGKRMDEAKREYGNAMNKLVEGKGNLISRVENLKLMGAKAKKALPENIIKRANDDLE
jgi:DNA recombination protein RmuC